MFDWLKGKKSYLTAAGGVIGGVVLILEGNLPVGIQMILTALGIATIRAGVAKGPDIA